MRQLNRPFAAFAAVLSALIMTLALAPPASADTRTFNDNREDVDGNYDIYWVRQTVDFDLVFETKLSGLSRSAQYYAWIEVGDGDFTPEYVWISNVGNSRDWALYNTRGWNPSGQPLDCNYDYSRNTQRKILTVEIAGDCHDPDTGFEQARLNLATAAQEIDWAPRERRYYAYVEGGEN